MTIGKSLKLCAVALLGAAVVVLPAAAGSETSPQVQAENVGLYAHYWTPASVPIEPGASVGFANPTGVAHGIRWVATPNGQNPTCSEGVPVGVDEKASGTKWSGSCTFAAAGEYSYYCTVHGAAMRGRVIVGVPATSTETTSTGTSTQPPTGSSTPTGQPTGPGVPPGSPLASSAASALRLSAPRHGATLHGSIDLSSAGAGGTLQLDLLAARASLASPSRSSSVRVGHLVRSHLPAGLTRFAIALDRDGRRALRARGHIALTVRARLTPPAGATISISRRLTMRR
jgi:plastocyanin